MEALYDISSIENRLRDLLKIIPRNTLDQIYTVIDDGVNRLHEPMQLAIIGKISSSKSTLVNAILGKTEIMSTGQKEVTYNVGWLKYGRPDSDIIIHHKDGSPNTLKSPKDFTLWTTEGKNKEIDNVSYIEIFDDAEILKEVNIIDTPGLDALRGKDSQNTLEFIKKVHPDAVIMLFTHSVSENVLDIVSQYNAGTSFNPLNALGILSKIDVLWQETFERDRTALEIGKKMTANRLRKNPMLYKTLFNIYPISALIFLAASTLPSEILEEIKTLAESDEEILKKSLNSVSAFVKEENELTLPVNKRQQLCDTVGLYGIYLILDLVRQNAQIDINDVKKRLWRESGAKEFMKVLHNHFGLRAKLIKIESIYQRIHQAIKESRGKTQDSSSIQLIYKIEQRVSEIFSSLVYEHREYEFLTKLYNNEINIDNETRTEFLNLCGEHGASAPERLGMKTSEIPVQKLIDKAQSGEIYWRKAVSLEPDPDEREWMNVVLASYTNLRLKLQTINYQYEQAKAFLFNE